MLKCGLVISTFIIVSLTSQPGHGPREKRTAFYDWPPKNNQSKSHLKFNTHIGNRQVRQAEQPVSNWANQYQNGIQLAENVTFSTNHPPNDKNNNSQYQNYHVNLFSEGTGMRTPNENLRLEYNSSQPPPNEGNLIKNKEYQNRSGYDNILYDKQLEDNNKESRSHDRSSSTLMQFNEIKRDGRQDETSYHNGPYDYDRYNRRPPPPPPISHEPWGPPHHYHWGPPPPPPPPHHHLWGPPPSPPPHNQWGPPPLPPPPPDHYRSPRGDQHRQPPPRVPPPDHSWPPRYDHCPPPPHDYRRPSPRDGYGPPPRDYHGPPRRDDRRPPPRHDRGPPPDDNYGPPPHDHFGPLSRDHHGPPPSDHHGPPPRDYHGPPPRDDRGPAPNDYRGPPPHEDRGPPPRDYHGPPPRDHAYDKQQQDHLQNKEKAQIIISILNDANSNRPSISTNKNGVIDQVTRESESKSATNTQTKREETEGNWQIDERFAERRTPQAWDDESHSFHESAELRGPPSAFSRSDRWGRRGPPSNRAPRDYNDPSDNRALLSISLFNGPPGQNKPHGNGNNGPPGHNKPPGNGNYGPPGHNKPSGNGNYGPPGHNKPSGNGNYGPPGHNKPNGNGPPGLNKPNGNGNKGPPGLNKPAENGNNVPSGQNYEYPSGNQDQNNNGYPPAAVTNKPNPETTSSSHNIDMNNYYITDKFSEGTPVPPDMMFQAIAVTPEQ